MSRFNWRGTVPSEWLNEDARSEDHCGVFCDEEPEVEFTDEWGVTNRVCRDCYDRQCGMCRGNIRDEYKRKGLCQSCRDEIRMWGGDEERGVEKDPNTEQTKLLTDGGNK